MKKHIAKFAIIFFIVIALLTYFSKTIDNFLLPQVKVTNLETGALNEQSASNDMKTHYLIPLSSVTSFGSDGTVFVLQTEESDTVTEVSVTIHDSDDFYYEVKVKLFHHSGIQIAQRNIADNRIDIVINQAVFCVIS